LLTHEKKATPNKIQPQITPKPYNRAN